MTLFRLNHGWETRLAREKMPAYLGYESEQHGKKRWRVLSLDVYPDLAEDGRALACWDSYDFDHDEEPPTRPSYALDTLPAEIRAIGEKRLLGLVLTPTERQKLKRFRDGCYTGQNGRPKKCHASDPGYERAKTAR